MGMYMHIYIHTYIAIHIAIRLNMYIDMYIYYYYLISVIIVAALTFFVVVASVVTLLITFTKKGKDFMSFFWFHLFKLRLLLCIFIDICYVFSDLIAPLIFLEIINSAMFAGAV